MSTVITFTTFTFGKPTFKESASTELSFKYLKVVPVVLTPYDLFMDLEGVIKK